MHGILLIHSLVPLSAGGTLAGLVALEGTPISNGALTSEQLPTRLKLLNWGENETTKGPVKVGEKTVKALTANQDRFGFDRIALDFAHNSLPGHPNFQKDPREVAAYGVPQVVPKDGVYLERIEWTPAGKRYAANYADLSPTPRITDGEVDFIHSVALCPQGAVKGLSFFSAEFLNLSAKHVAIAAASKTMDFKKLLCTLLGLAFDASDDEIETAAKAAASKLEGTKKEAKDAPPEEDSDVVKAMNARFDSIEKGLKALSASRETEERTRLLALAASEGKVVPPSAQKFSIADLKALVAELPVTVPLDQRTPEHAQEAGGNVGGAAEKHVMKALNISEEDWKKYAPKS